MNQIEAFQRLQTLATPAFETRDAAALLRVTPSNANMILRRLANEGMITHLSRGRWLTNRTVSRFALPELISPLPCVYFLAIRTISSRPDRADSIGHLCRHARTSPACQNTVGNISLHRIPPELFNDFELAAESEAKIATPEKRSSTLYLAPAVHACFRGFRNSQCRGAFRGRV